jgi:hypothetical protein
VVLLITGAANAVNECDRKKDRKTIKYNAPERNIYWGIAVDTEWE